MKIGDHVFFAPGILFTRLDLSSPRIVQQFEARMEGYYSSPVRLLAKHRHDFGAAILLASCMDALGRYSSQAPQSWRNHQRKKYVNWIQSAIRSLSNGPSAEDFYENFRCGLVHEARAKTAGELRRDIKVAVVVDRGVMALNAVRLAIEVKQSLTNFCHKMINDPPALAAFQACLQIDFALELKLAATTSKPGK